MPLRGAAKAEMQERILNTADALFYTHGIQAVGVDLIAAEVGISKRTLYNYYGSKSELICAYLERWNAPTPPATLPPKERILAEFDRLAARFLQSNYRGCPFINAVAEAAEPSKEVLNLAKKFKNNRRRWFLGCLKELKVKNAEVLAGQLMLLVDGAIVTMMVQCDPNVAHLAKKAAEELLSSSLK
jgi:AcrR family transcriptional regulator